MNDTALKLLDKIRALENDMEEELHRRADELLYKVRDGRVTFEREVIARHKALKVSTARYIRDARWIVILTAPVIYSLIIPFVLLDIFVTIYQFICFPIYQIPKVKRGDYLVFDRVKLKYLNSIEKFNCLYCSYGNGIVAYVQEVAARTEQYWCPIKHALKEKGRHAHYHKFTDFGDAEQYHQRLRAVRQDFEQ